MTAWITRQQATQLLGGRVSLAGKLAAKGELTSRGPEGKVSLNRDQMIGVRALREERDRTRSSPRRTQPGRTARPTRSTCG